ncbi:MAG: flavin reductase family protein [Bacteroidetes bacterium]|nr:flavin reductase family protein [Bacteroidota bacterium]
MKTLDASAIAQNYLHRIMLGTIAPRPIAFASTVDAAGNENLAPFSFFNAFGVNPGTLIFSPSRRGRDNTTKHTYENLLEVPEVVINIVTYEMVQQMSLASCEFPKGISEFVKAGFTPLPSERIRPPRVKESPVQYECKVRQIIETGTGPGAGNLVICDILLVHLDEDILSPEGEIDPTKINQVGRLGGDYYVKVDDYSRFVVPKPNVHNGIGIDALPEYIRYSPLLTGNELGMLGNLSRFPSNEELEAVQQNPVSTSGLPLRTEDIFAHAKKLLAQGNAPQALAWLIACMPKP